MIFQYELEPVEIQRILISFEAIHKNFLTFAAHSRFAVFLLGPVPRSQILPEA